MSNGPLPSQLCLLSSLSHREVGDKVRFLGCVASYSPASGILALQHEAGRDVAGGSVEALVDVQLVLENLGAEQTRIGEWVNVIGYVTAPPRAAAPPTAAGPRESSRAVHVQALVLWSAGPVHVQQYRRSAQALWRGSV